MEKKELEELALRKLLQQATYPEPPSGSAERLLGRIAVASAPATGNVTPLMRRPANLLRRLMTAGLPLAASLLLGILIGSDSMLNGFLPESVVTLIQPADLDLDVPDLLGVDDGLEGDLA